MRPGYARRRVDLLEILTLRRLVKPSWTRALAHWVSISGIKRIDEAYFEDGASQTLTGRDPGPEQYIRMNLTIPMI
jgi:hypothetical protein